MIVDRAKLLTDQQVVRVHQASLEILEETGLLVRNRKARRRFAEHGCKVDEDGQFVRMPAKVVERAMDAAPPTFTFRGRDPEFDRVVPGDGPLIATASSAPNVIDPLDGAERRATSADIARIAHLIDALPGYDVFSVSTLADDAPEGRFSLSRFYPALKNCRKPIRASLLNPGEAEDMIRLCSLIAGSEERFRERPFVTFGYCSVVSPLAMDYDATGMLMYYAEQGIPAHSITVPNGGLSAPLTLAATLVQGNAEFLAASVLTQMSKPGTPLLFLALPTIADMRTGAYASGAIETGMLDMGVAQMARHYGVPSGGYIGQTNAKVSDAQAGFEKAMSPVAAVLAGFDVLQLGGLLDSLLAFDFGQAVIDGEIGLMLKRLARGLEFGDDDLALEVIAEVGPGGMFIGHPHTYGRMRTTALLPEIADRESRQGWLEKGGLDAHARAMRRAREILTERNHSVLAPEVDAAIRARFEGLVAGDSTPPEGWRRPPPRRLRRAVTGRRRRRDARPAV